MSLEKNKNKQKIKELGLLIKKVCRSFNIQIELEPEWGHVGRIKRKDGSFSYFRNHIMDINRMGAHEVAKDKDYTYYFLKKDGFPIIPNSKVFYSDSWARIVGKTKQNAKAGLLHAKKIGFPVVLKPNSGSQGSSVFVVLDDKSFLRAINQIFKRDKIAIVQEYIEGTDLRVVVLDNEILLSYQRIPLYVVGDGKSTIETLFERKKKELNKSGRFLRINIDDKRIRNKLKILKINKFTIPPKNEKVFLLTNGNLSTGGESKDITKKLEPELRKLSLKIAKNSGLRFCAIDLIRQEKKGKNKYFILEINSIPGFSHYMKESKENKKKVLDIYSKVLIKIENEK